jgi:ankyrin repeat protein
MADDTLKQIYRLMEHEINAADKNGNTALILASCNGHADIVQALIAKGVRTPLGPDEIEFSHGLLDLCTSTYWDALHRQPSAFVLGQQSRPRTNCAGMPIRFG